MFSVWIWSPMRLWRHGGPCFSSLKSASAKSSRIRSSTKSERWVVLGDLFWRLGRTVGLSSIAKIPTYRHLEVYFLRSITILFSARDSANSMRFNELVAMNHVCLTFAFPLIDNVDWISWGFFLCSLGRCQMSYRRFLAGNTAEIYDASDLFLQMNAYN